MYGNEDGLINQIAAISLTKTFGKVKTAKLETETDTSKIDLSSVTQSQGKDLKEIEELRKAVEEVKAKNEALRVQNEKLKLMAEKVIIENNTSKALIIDLIKVNEKIKLEKEMLKNKILEKESEDLRRQIEESNQVNKPSVKFLTMFGTFFVFVLLSLTSLIGSIINRIFYRSVKV